MNVIVAGLAAWVVLSVPVALIAGRVLRGRSSQYPPVDVAGSPTRTVVETRTGAGESTGPTGTPSPPGGPAATQRRQPEPGLDTPARLPEQLTRIARGPSSASDSERNFR